MAGLPVAAVLSQLRAPSGARLPVEATELVASFVPRSLAFGSLPYPFGGFYELSPFRDEVVSYGEMRRRIYRYIVDGETVGGPEAELYEPGWRGDNFEVIVEYGIKLLMFLGLDDRVALYSIFLPPVSSQGCELRALALCMCIGFRVSRARERWVHEHGETPEVIEWDSEVVAWRDLRMSDP